MAAAAIRRLAAFHILFNGKNTTDAIAAEFSDDILALKKLVE